MRNAFLPLAAVSLFSLVALQTLPSAHVPVSVTTAGRRAESGTGILPRDKALRD